MDVLFMISGLKLHDLSLAFIIKQRVGQAGHKIIRHVDENMRTQEKRIIIIIIIYLTSCTPITCTPIHLNQDQMV